jgi:hypothetical protein
MLTFSKNLEEGFCGVTHLLNIGNVYWFLNITAAGYMIGLNILRICFVIFFSWPVFSTFSLVSVPGSTGTKIENCLPIFFE